MMHLEIMVTCETSQGNSGTSKFEAKAITTNKHLWTAVDFAATK